MCSCPITYVTCAIPFLFRFYTGTFKPSDILCHVGRFQIHYCYTFPRRLRLKYDGTRAKTRFRFSAKRTSPFKSAGASVQSTTDSRGVRISGSNAGYTMFRGSVKSTGYLLHPPVSPSLPLPCVTVCHHVSTGFLTYTDRASFEGFRGVGWDSVILEYQAASVSNGFLAFRSNIIHHLQGQKGMRFLRNVGNRLPIIIPKKGIITYGWTSRHSLLPHAGDKNVSSDATTPPHLRDAKILGEKFTLYIIWATVLRIRSTQHSLCGGMTSGSKIFTPVSCILLFASDVNEGGQTWGHHTINLSLYIRESMLKVCWKQQHGCCKCWKKAGKCQTGSGVTRHSAPLEGLNMLQQVAHHLSTITSTVPSQRWLPHARLILWNAFRPLLAILCQAIVLRPQTGTPF
jgi:hypothetical protein